MSGSEEVPAGANAGPGTSPHAEPLVQHCWQTAFDHNSRRWYFYNTASGERTWHPPPGWLPPVVAPLPPPPLHPAHAAALAAAHAAAAHHLAAVSTASPTATAAADEAGAADSHGSNAGQGRQASGSPVASRPGSSTADSSDEPTDPVAAAPAAAATTAPAAAATTAPAPAAVPPGLPSDQGYYYVDAYGVWQGPFTKEQLQGWRGQLPMDLPVRYRDPQQPAAAAHALELAKVLGDGELLVRWRGDNPDKAAIPNSAPPAEQFERELRSGGSYSDYAAAALAGLPAHDEAVQVARLAAFSGRSIQDLLNFSYGSGGIGDYTMTALHSKGRGKIQAADAQSEGLYDEMGRWVDASSVEEQLAKAAEARKKGLSGKELQALKARKQEMKKKRQMDWLMR